MFIFFSYSIKFFFFDMEICTIKEMNWELTCHWCGWWSASSLIQKKNQKLSEIVYTYVSLHLLLHVPRKYPAYKLTKKKTPRKTCFNLDFLLLFLLVCLFFIELFVFNQQQLTLYVIISAYTQSNFYFPLRFRCIFYNFLRYTYAHLNMSCSFKDQVVS